MPITRHFKAQAMRSELGRPRTRVDWLVVLALLLLALPITFHRLGYQSLWLDEGRTQEYVTSHRLGALLLDLFDPTQAYPLYHLVVKVTTRALGDGEMALRLPSAVAGALAVPALYLLGNELRGRAVGLAASTMLLIAPWALRQAQDAKTYSLALLTTILLALLLARALRLGTRSAALSFALVALIAPFVHRLLLLSLLGCVACWAITLPRSRRWPLLLATVAGGVAVIGGIAGVLQYQRAGGQFVGVDPLAAAALTFSQFSVGQYPGAVPGIWLVPFGVLLVLGGMRAIYDLRMDRARSPRPEEKTRASVRLPGAALLLLLGGLPLALFLILLLVQPLYESRYLVGVYPFWLLLLAWAVAPARGGVRPIAVLALPALALVLLVQQRALVQTGKGIFSGARIKEDYGSAVRHLAAHVHPDDLVIVHPAAIRPLYDYYARRVALDPLPEPVELTSLFQQELGRKELERNLRVLLEPHKRAWLLIAPDHARIVDPPLSPTDDVGLLGLAFQFGDEERRILCGEQPYAGFNGVRVYCNNLPDVGGKPPEPEQPLEVVFNGEMRLRGYTVTPFPGGPTAGGSLPITLFWQPLADLSGTDYIVFLHLTRPDDPAPLVQTDGRPMEGGLPTAHWIDPGALLHDDRTIPLPTTLSPGRYVLRMGVYRAQDGTRLHAETAAPALDDAVVLGEVTVAAP